MLNENLLIQNLQQQFPEFIGDDAATLPTLENQQYIISKDLLVEDVHFRIRYFTADDLAHKALHVNLSDLAAMGAKPLYILCGIAVPKNLQKYAMEVLEALVKICHIEQIKLIGGDTTAAADKLTISITAIGQVNQKQVKYRHRAQAMDSLFVAGNLGWSRLGLQALEENRVIDSKYIHSCLRPKAKIAEGIWLSQQVGVHSMMDISDGLCLDLPKLCRASAVGATISLEKLQQYVTQDLSLATILEGGEDYGLLFSCAPAASTKITANFLAKFGYPLKFIGQVNADAKISFTPNNQSLNLTLKPFTHFDEQHEV